jgi:S-adenosylmethionine:tRNA ribosyltransferase-isomerase
MMRFSVPKISRSAGQRPLHTVSVQLDYYMSTQFAGIACAMTNQLYEKGGIDLQFLPICPVGLELQRVRDHANSNTSSVTVGSVEQNIFTPTLYKDPSLRLKTVAAMFRRSPLCLASLDSGQKMKDNNVVGAHDDTVSLIERILREGPDADKYSVISSARATKNTDLLTGKLDAIQAYLTTEVPTLEQIDTNVLAMPLEGMNGAKLGYSQILFCPEEDVESLDRREVVQAFLDATFRGWEMAIRDNESAAKSVDEARAMLGLDEESNDHWHPSFSYTVQSVGMCCDFVKETFQGDRYGVVNAKRWNEANKWLLSDDSPTSVVDDNFGFAPDVWQPPTNLLAGNELARVTLDSANKSAYEFAKVHGRKPSLAVITVGELPRYAHGPRRLEIYSNQSNSWFNKTGVGKANGYDVKEISLPESTTTEELLDRIYRFKDKDGIQLMWPLPAHIDSAQVFSAISVSQDVDGAHYIGQLELAPESTPLPPVTPAGVLAVADEYGIDLKNASVLVVGRSRIIGSPLAHMLRERGAVVTVAHSEVAPEKLQALVQDADIVMACAGSPGLLKAEWIKDGAQVINVGTTFVKEKDTLVSDFEGDLATKASRFSPVPGGVGPLSAPHLFKNVVTAAWARMESSSGHVEKTWTRKSASIERWIHFADYDSALSFATKVNALSSKMDHHANMEFTHKCVDGVDLRLEFFSFLAGDVTAKDYLMAAAVDKMLEKETIQMSDYTYNLNPDSIAKFPAEPRGSSKLLHVDEHGNAQHFSNFSDSFMSLAEGAHVVFNESRVVQARVDVTDDTLDGKRMEMMILDVGECSDKESNGLRLAVMLRCEGIQEGQVFLDASSGKAKFKVVEVVGPWIEDEKSNGNGTECIVECCVQTSTPLDDLLANIGSVPIPPYLQREAQPSDVAAYNNVYAAQGGSVAAPTAGLHFTEDLMKQIGPDNTSFLTLHVGAGTFKPVVATNALDHKMHAEIFGIKVVEIERIIDALESGKRIIVVGTTGSRTLESLYWCGVKAILGITPKNNEGYSLGQKEWTQYVDQAAHISTVDALKAVIGNKSSNDVVSGKTSLMIVPHSYDFKVVNELITNFHAPDSTLMLLVSAFLGGGDKVKEVYEGAQERGYKFLSYGDVCLFSRAKK